MAEAAVAIVINKAIAAKALLKGEGHRLQENINRIQTQMETLQSYLKDAESKKATDFYNSVRDLALDVEDSLDTYLPEIEYHRSKGPFGILKHSSCIPCYGVTENEFSLELEEFKKRAAKIEQSKGDITAEPDVDRKFWEKAKFKKTVFWRKECEIIKEKVYADDDKCRIIPIIGPGGVGKTTLAREIYNQVETEFDCTAMVYISEDSTVGELVLDIARQVELPRSEMKQNRQENLRSFLHKKKYMIFFDDFSDKWDSLRDVVMTNSRKGSRIIVTCREEEFQNLASRFDDLGRKELLDYSIALKPLSDGEGERLFYDSMEETLSLELKNIGDKIVQKCGGLPLAIHVAAGLLKAKKRDERSWNEVFERMNGDVENERMILDLSYQDLPANLKPFFLYFGIFPKNSEIYVSELVRLWIAEKLVIQVDESRKPDKIVEDCINELIERNLIQVSRTRFDERVKSCSIQNVLHDLCTRKAEDINFFFTWNPYLASTARRVVSNFSSAKSKAPGKLRALLCFSKGRELAESIRSNVSDLRFLQLLSIQIEFKAINIPVEIADLSGLIYLKLEGQFITVPSSIGKLKRLETLEVRTREVPESILKMKHLKHLFVSGVVKSKIKERGAGLEVDLQNLETLDFDYQFGYHLSPSSFKKLPSLKMLKTVVASTLKLDAFCDTTPLLEKLERLKLRVGSTSEIPPNQNFSHYKNLRTLYLFFDSSNISCSFDFPETLVKITLGGLDTEEKDPLERLKGLPSLEIIKLKNCNGRKFDFSGSGYFPQLKMLMLHDTKFQLLVADEKGMPKLNKFICKPHPKQSSKLPEKLKKVMANHRMLRSPSRVIDVL